LKAVIQADVADRLAVIQAPTTELSHHALERSVVTPMLPNESRGIPRVDDRRIFNGIFWVLRTGAPWRDLPDSYGPHTTCYNRFVRWRRAGIWDQIMNAMAVGYDAAVQMIDTSMSACTNMVPASPTTAANTLVALVAG
jgi:transposase